MALFRDTTKPITVSLSLIHTHTLRLANQFLPHVAPVDWEAGARDMHLFLPSCCTIKNLPTRTGVAT